MSRIHSGLLTFLCWLLMVPAHSQLYPDSLFEGSVLVADIDSLHSTLLRTHVNPYVFCTQEELETAFSNARSKVADGMTLRQFVPVVGQLLQVLKDSHTCLNFPYLDSQLLDSGKRKLMFHLLENKDGFFVAEDMIGELTVGSEIVSINAIDMKTLHERMLSYSSIEGNSVEGFHRIANALIGPIGSLEIDVLKKNIIGIKLPGSDSVSFVEYPGLRKKEIKVVRRLWFDYQGIKPRDRVYDLNFEDDLNLAVLKIGSFSSGSARTFNRFLKQSFREIQEKGIGHLVVDIRDNTGGQSVRMERLLAYLCENQPSVPNNIIARQSPLARERVHKTYRGLNKFMINNFFGKNEEVLAFRTMMKLKDGEQDTLYFREPERVSRNLNYHGKCFLLMNGMSASASVNFASAFRTLARGPIIGESCLGPMSGTWGNPSVYQLQNSGIEVFISTIRFNADDSFSYPVEPIRPDYEVPTTASDLINNIDSQMQFVRELIR